MGAALETLVFARELGEPAGVYCLLCRERLGSLRHAPARQGVHGESVAVSLDPQRLEDFRQDGLRVVVTCRCGGRSTFHLVS